MPWSVPTRPGKLLRMLRGAMALVVVGAPLGLSGAHRQNGLSGTRESEVRLRLDGERWRSIARVHLHRRRWPHNRPRRAARNDRPGVRWTDPPRASFG